MNRAHRVVADRVVALGGVADKLAGVGHELAGDRVGGIAGPDERGKRRRDGDRIAPGDRLELLEPFRRGEPRRDQGPGGGQTVRRWLDGHASGLSCDRDLYGSLTPGSNNPRRILIRASTRDRE